MDAQTTKAARRYCSNCYCHLPRRADFCPKCGQRRSTGRAKMKDLLLRLWNTTFHLENKFLRMVWHLFVPAKATIAYFKGHLRRYPHPIQFFLVCVFFFLLFVSQSTKNKNGESFSLIQLFGNEAPERLAGKLELQEALRQNLDSLPTRLQSPLAREAVDSLLLFSTREHWFARDTLRTSDVMIFGSAYDYRIPYRDILELSPDSVLTKYNVEPRWYRFVLRQVIKASKDSKGVGKFWIGMLGWIVLSLVVVMAGWLKLLYIRRDRYFVEHFVLLLHHHSGFIFLLTLLGTGRKIFHYDKDWILLSVWWFVLGWWWAMWRYYGQRKTKTIFKWLIFWFLYFLSLVVLLLLSFGVSVLFF
jgi:hypothetical protein